MGNCIEGKCPITWCTERVTIENFVLAHNKPFAAGGATDMANLSVTCAACNLSMGHSYTVDAWNALGPAARGGEGGGSASKAAKIKWMGATAHHPSDGGKPAAYAGAGKGPAVVTKPADGTAASYAPLASRPAAVPVAAPRSSWCFC